MSNILGRPYSIPIKHLIVALVLVLGSSFVFAGHFPEETAGIGVLENSVEVATQALENPALAPISDAGIGEAPAENKNVQIGYDSLYLTLAIMAGVLFLVIILLIFHFCEPCEPDSGA